jgi:hypothetical protein
MKKLILISSFALVLTISIVTLKLNIFEDNQKNIKFRVDPQQDTQVKNTESMLSNSLTKVVKDINIQERNDNLPEQNETTNVSRLSNQSLDK